MPYNYCPSHYWFTNCVLTWHLPGGSLKILNISIYISQKCFANFPFEVTYFPFSRAQWFEYLFIHGDCVCYGNFNKPYISSSCASHVLSHYSNVIMSAVASQITSLTIVYSTVFSGENERKHQTLHHWHLCGEFTVGRWIACPNGGIMFCHQIKNIW